MPTPDLLQDPPEAEQDMVSYRVIKRLPGGLIVYDRVRRPWWAPWRHIVSRNRIQESAFKILTYNKKVEGSRDEEI